jgi:pyruvate kinase
VFRLNFSHGTQEDHKKRYDIIRSIEKDVGRPIGVLVDLQGAELRVGTFSTRPHDPGPLVLNLPSTLMAAPGEKERVSLPHPEIFQALSPGVQLLLDDGKVRLEVESCGPGKATTRVLVGGAL